MKKAMILLVLYLSIGQINILAQEEARLLRFPAIHDNQIVFTYAGDLYTVSADGGTARKLTNHNGYEMFARFSPDGKTLAFTGQYDGNTEVFVMNSNGGVPKRLTFTATLGRDDVSDRMGPNNIVMGWTHDNKNIIFRSRKDSFNDFNGGLYTVNTDGSLPKQLPVPRGGFCSYSADDQKMAYNRIFREFRTWKRYRGGMADDIWIFDFKTNKVEDITNNPAQDIIPMWYGTKIYFLSDRDEKKRMNMYVYDLTTKETKKLTNYKDFDIKFPSLGDKAIVYENAGYIYKMDLATEESKKVNIIIAEDFLSGRPYLKDVSKEISNFEISPDGKRAIFGAHGDVFTVPEKYGETRNLTNSSSIHERDSKWSDDGKWISYISDKTGEDEIFVQTQDASQPPVQVTTGVNDYKYQPYWSPDSKKLMWSDRNQRLYFIDINTKQMTTVDTDSIFEMKEYAWSPDSKWITYTKNSSNLMQQVFLYSLEQAKSFPVTENWYNASGSVFSEDGKYLFFVSSRDFKPDFSSYGSTISYSDMSSIYYVSLNKEAQSLFRLRSDEVDLTASEAKKPLPEIKKEAKSNAPDKKEETKSAEKYPAVQVDIDGLLQRIGRLPIKASNYYHISAVDNKLYYQRKGSSENSISLLMYDFDAREEKNLGAVDGYEISANKKKMLVAQSSSYGIINIPSAEVKISDKLNLSGLQIEINQHEEWNQIYWECWRQMRDFFYSPLMNGVDWKAEGEKYGELVKYVNHRNDLTYIIGELIGELNIGHAYVGEGGRPQPERIKTGLLGAEITKDKASGYFRIDKILKGENWNNSTRSPLTDIGIDVKEGDFILAVDGKPVNNLNNIYAALVNKAGKQVKLTINSNPVEKGKHETTVMPTGDEAKLYYLKWVNDNIEKVSKATNGQVGYLHIPDMGTEGLNDFIKSYYPQLEKKALIIDVRGNAGGFVSQIVIENLRRVASQITIARNTKPAIDPDGTLYGPMVMLSNEFSASDGDIVTYRFKFYKLGKVVGKRTWGGVTGIRGTLPLVDGGMSEKPEFSRYDLEGKNWIIEGVGVEPDIVVDNDPYLEFTGTDEQLNKAIEVILEDLKTKGKTIPEHPAFPTK